MRVMGDPGAAQQVPGAVMRRYSPATSRRRKTTYAATSGTTM
jgi:hypothetical protein